MEWTYDDGGRSRYFKAEKVGDCCARAIAIATQTDYKVVYDLINEYAKQERTGKRKKSISNARNGVYRDTAKKVMAELGWEWHPVMGIGTGCTMHMNPDELPKGRIVVSLSKHYAAVVDGVLHDTYDSTRGGTRCVYGYWSK